MANRSYTRKPNTVSFNKIQNRNKVKKNPKVFHNLLRQQDSCYLLNKQKIHLQNHIIIVRDFFMNDKLLLKKRILISYASWRTRFCIAVAIRLVEKVAAISIQPHESHTRMEPAHCFLRFLPSPPPHPLDCPSSFPPPSRSLLSEQRLEYIQRNFSIVSMRIAVLIMIEVNF